MKSIDLIGIGLGPFNLSLAALLNPIDGINSVFFERQTEFNWHPGLLMEDCTLQVPMMADLVTMADPTNRFSYLNYLHHKQRLYQFYFYEDFFIPRIDYNRYCQWVSEQLPDIKFAHTVTAVKAGPDGYQVVVHDHQQELETIYHAKHIVLGTGSVPAMPAGLEHCAGLQHCLHSSQYLNRKSAIQAGGSITVVGAGQSAAEIVLDLLNEQQQHDYEINWLTQSDGFLPMEYSKLGLEHFSPDYIDHFYSLPANMKDHIRSGQGLWYKGISSKTIADIYDRIYARSIDQAVPVTLQARSRLLNVEQQSSQLALQFQHLDKQQEFGFTTDNLILATGYNHVIPECLKPLSKQLQWDDQQRLIVNRDYTLASKTPLPGQLYIQNGEMHSHGIGAPDLGLGAYRSASIINHLLGKEYYPLRSRNVFQQFGIAPHWQQNSAQPRLKEQP